MRVRKIYWHILSYKYKLKFKKFGKYSYIAKPLFIDINRGKVITKDKLRIQPGLRMELLNKDSSILIGENVSIGQNFHITSGGKLEIGKDVVISGNVFITNIDHEYQEINVPILEQKNKITSTVIGDNCFIGYGVSIQAGTKLGKQCIVGTNAVVRGEFPDYSVIVGVPAKIIKRYDFKQNKWISVKL
ncbi:acyltransferase [Beduini massiliensis]|uniref:acyltransferase n=1 Tax=Beduini massiliensis TaxID=1585974 RepID=UPI0006946D23|nr:acyltransferase [Beduini massiliensis]